MGCSELLNREQNLEAGKQLPIPALGNGTSTVTGGGVRHLAVCFPCWCSLPFPQVSEGCLGFAACSWSNRSLSCLWQCLLHLR